MRYRPDIDGLRAFAIGAVILFHLGLGPVSGGFAGVDIFFVISGYLITGLILGPLREGEFSFWEFYARRTRRIYPALFVVIAMVLIAGYYLLAPHAYEALGVSAVFSSVGLANVYFWLNTGYFDPAAETMPLLHIWSIAVEEQFYLAWPLTLFLIWRFAKTSDAALRTTFLLATILLAILCVVLTAQNEKAAFFLPFARLWEFTLGAFVFMLAPMREGRVADAISVSGILAMVAAVMLFNESVTWPGYAAILPCLGAAAVIAAGERSLVGRFLSLGPNVFLGKISYSVYLWHWPLIVYFTAHAGHLSTDKKILVLLIALAISVVSWRLIETPIRRQRGDARRHVAIGGAAAAAAACFALFVVAKEGFSDRLDGEVQRIMAYRNYARGPIFREGVCFLRPEQTVAELDKSICLPSGRPSVVLWGSSHIAQFFGGLGPHLESRGYSLGQITGSACMPLVGLDVEARPNCRALNDFAIEWLLLNKPSIVVMGGDPLTPSDVANLNGSVKKLVEAGIQVIVLGPVPYFKKPVPDILVDRILRGDRDTVAGADMVDAPVVDRLLRDNYYRHALSQYVSFPCPRSGCLLAVNGTPLHFDLVHFTQEGSDYYGARLADFIDTANKSRPATLTQAPR